MNLVDFVFQILITKAGFGRHMYYLTLEQIVACGLYFHIIEVLYVMSTAVVKVSACLFLLRIMARGTSKLMRYFLHGLMAILMILCIACSLVIILQCMPVESGWDPRVKGRCWKFNQILGIGYAQNGMILGSNAYPWAQSSLKNSMGHSIRSRLCSVPYHHPPKIADQHEEQIRTLRHHGHGPSVCYTRLT